MVRPFENQLRELHAFAGRGARIMSLYLRTNPAAVDTAAVMEQLRGVVRALRAGLDDAHRDQLDDDLEMVRDYLGSMVAPPPAVAVFACAPRHFFRVVRLPLDISPAVYWSETVETGPLLETAARVEAVFGGGTRETVTL